MIFTVTLAIPIPTGRIYDKSPLVMEEARDEEFACDRKEHSFYLDVESDYSETLNSDAEVENNRES